MTEDQIERKVEGMFDLLDMRLTSGKMTQAEYEEECEEIRDWASRQYRRLKGKRLQSGH